MSAGNSAVQSEESIPVYEVTRAGIGDVEAKKLAEALDIPADKLVLRGGVVSFVDLTNYLNVPTVEVSDSGRPREVAPPESATADERPEIRLRLEAIDFAALEKLTVLGAEVALKKSADGFASAD